MLPVTTRMKFDDILQMIGDVGTYQVFLLLMVCLTSLPGGMISLSGVFLIAEVDHWCAVEEWENDVSNCYNLLRSSENDYLQCIHQYRESSVPKSFDDGETVHDECVKYDTEYPDVWSKDYFASNFTTNTTSCDNGWVYDRSQYASTVTGDFDLVCEKKALVETTQSLFYFGFLLGTIIYTISADFIGRKFTFLISIACNLLVTLATAFSKSLVMFGILRVLNGAFNVSMFTAATVIDTGLLEGSWLIGSGGLMQLGASMSIEFVGPSKRVYAGVLISIAYGCGNMTLGPVAYLFRDWRMLQIVVACCTAPCLLLFIILPESARWLISKNRIKPAVEIIRKIAERNKTTDKLPPNLEDILVEENKLSACEERVTFIDLFRTPGLRLITINTMFNWFVNTLIYYGLSFNTVKLGGNDYLAFFLSGLVEIPAYLISIPLIESRLGRRGATCLLELIGGISCITTAFLAEGVAKTTVAMIGKFCISTSFGIIYIYTAEIFPTVARSAGFGLCSTAGRIGSIMAPLILALGEFIEFLPLLVYGIIAVTGGLLVLLLPETRGTKLPDNLSEYNGQTNRAYQAEPKGGERVCIASRPLKDTDIEQAGREEGHVGEVRL